MFKIVHFEIGADDPDRAQKFYKDIFGWNMEKMEGEGEYWLITAGSEKDPGINGGLFKRPGPVNSNTINTVEVPSVDEYIKKITDSGGKIVQAKQAIAGVGWLAYFQDPEGNYLGILQNDETAG